MSLQRLNKLRQKLVKRTGYDWNDVRSMSLDEAQREVEHFQRSGWPETTDGTGGGGCCCDGDKFDRKAASQISWDY